MRLTLSRSLVLLASLVLSSPAFALADMQISSFSDTPDPVPAGGNVTYQIQVTNNGADPATNVKVSMPIPAEASFVSATAPCTLVGNAVECNLNNVPGNGIQALDIVLRAKVPGPATITPTASVVSDNDSNPSNNSQSQTTTITAGGDLSLTKTGTPDPVSGGANITYTLTPHNAGPNSSGDIVLTDNLPPSVTAISAVGSGWSCQIQAATVTCRHPGPHAPQQLSDPSSIPAVTIVGRVDAGSGSITNTATIAPADGGTQDPNTSNNTALATTAVTPGADLRIAQKRVISPTPAIAGQDVTFEIQPRNSGPSTAAIARVTDTLPPGWTLVSISGPNWTCSVATADCTRASFPTTATDNITVVATAPSNVAVGAGATYTNNAAISSATADPVATNNTGAVAINVLPDGADLSLRKNKSPNPVAQGAQLTSNIDVTNNGPRNATGPIRIVEVLSAGETFVNATGTGWSCTQNANTVVCTHPNTAGLAVNSQLPPLSIVTRATGAGSLTNTACTSGSLPPDAASGTTSLPPLEGDSNTNNDCASATSLSTSIKPDLQITKVTKTPAGGDKRVTVTEAAVTYELVVTNVTASPATDGATGIVISDYVPAYYLTAAARTSIDPIVPIVSSGSTATFNCSIADAQTTCTQSGGVLKPGESVTIPITVNRPMVEGSFTNWSFVSNNAEGDPNPNNNRSSDEVQIDPIADVEVSGKTVTPSTVRAGENATYVISYRNNGPASAQNVVINDVLTLPSGDSGAQVVSVVSSKPNTTCTLAAGTTLTTGANSYSCNIGTLLDGATESITVVIRPLFQSGNVSRSYSNTASITTTTAESPTGGNNNNNSKTATLTIGPALLDLLVNKADLLDPVMADTAGTFINYRVRVTNNGPSYASDVRVTENMTPPAGKRVRFICDTNGPSSATCNSPSRCSASNLTSAPGAALTGFTCTIPAETATTGSGQGELAVNQSKNIYLRFQALDQPGETGDIYTNQVTVAANEPDSFPANDTTAEQTTVRQRVDLAVTKTASTNAVTIGQPFTWTIKVTNLGPGDAVQADITDILPTGVSLTGPATYSTTNGARTGNCTANASTLVCAMGRLNNGEEATITVPVKVDTAGSGTVTNKATVDISPQKIGGIDSVASNNEAFSSVSVLASSIRGRVFIDPNNNGLYDAGEPRLAGVTVTLTGTTNLGQAVNVSVTTDANGQYVFNNLAPGTYTVTEPNQPAGTQNGTTRAGTINGVPTGAATDVNTTPSAISSITLGGNQNSIDNNFGETAQSPDLLVSKSSTQTKLTVNQLITYTLQVRNAGNQPTVGTYTVSDRLPVGLTLANVPTGTAWTCSGAAGAASFTCSSSSVLAAGATSANPITVAVQVGNAALNNSPARNAVMAEGGGEIDALKPSQADRDAFNGDVNALPDCVSAIQHKACKLAIPVQASSAVSGTVWYDIGNQNHLLDGADQRLAGWLVEVLNGNNIVGRATTDGSGRYRIDNLAPGTPLQIRFRDPQSGIVWGYPVNGETAPDSSNVTCNEAQAIASGQTSSCTSTPGSSPVLRVVLKSGETLTQQSLPVDPNGVVYNSTTRQAVPGSVVTLEPEGSCPGWNPATSIVAGNLGGYSLNGNAISMTVGNEGFYQFLFSSTAPASCQFKLTVKPPSGYQFVSKQIPPQSDTLNPPGGPTSSYAVQSQGLPPRGSDRTLYYLSFLGGSAQPYVVHNHIPIDPNAAGELSLVKVGDRSSVEIGDTVRYTLTVVLRKGTVPQRVTIVDSLPAGFTFINGTASVNGHSIADPQGRPGPRLAFNLDGAVLNQNRELTLQYRLRVGVGSLQGDGINRAVGYACNAPSCVTSNFNPISSAVATNQAQYHVGIGGGAFTTEVCVLGKIFVDCNNNHIQDPEELGIPGVRVILNNGTMLISDSEGKYNLCGLLPRSYVLKVDSYTLPRHARLTTSSNRNLGDANSLWLDLKNGELHRADFIEGSCSNEVLDQVKARRAQGEVSSAETEPKRQPPLRFDSKAHGLNDITTPQQGTDSANQEVPKPRVILKTPSVLKDLNSGISQPARGIYD